MKASGFFRLLQVAIGNCACLSHPLTEREWHEMLAMANKQALVGILFEGVKKLPKEQWPKSDIVLKWTVAAESIRRRNMKTTHVCLLLTKTLLQDGFDSCILKGQSNHVYYDRLMADGSLGLARTCGDIDAWIWPKKTTKHPVRSIIDYCIRRKILLSLCHLHAEVKPIQGVPVEIHFRPSFLNAPWRDRAFQKLFKAAKFVEEDIDGCGILKKLRVDYDLVFQMNHIYRHLLDEGVGMRQILDFYVLLKDYDKESAGNAKLMDRNEIMKQVSSCGMTRFAMALMYVLKVTINAEESVLLCAPSEKHGGFLLSEIMAAGNFGHYDDRVSSLELKRGHLSYQLRKAYRRFRRNLRFLTSYPEEVVCEPLARIVHTLWRKFRLYRFYLPQKAVILPLR